ncbi:hypothetical protein MAR_001175 [Mya arenaria]|uniref:Uncharacterized protein n=1 Tax=Mya arenaria TaxID=6604 RepID=A0ABY7FCK7_MYAAR|nr:hypothetical protein MAR_001175 [Mya arenaria]
MQARCNCSQTIKVVDKDDHEVVEETLEISKHDAKGDTEVLTGIQGHQAEQDLEVLSDTLDVPLALRCLSAKSVACTAELLREP